MNRRSCKGLKLILAVLLTIYLPFTAAVTTAAPEPLQIGIHVDEGPLTPYGYTFGYPGLQLVRVIYDTLFVMDAERQPIPWMVEDYQVSSDGLAWTMTLHEGITFHDGQPLTAHDVEFTYTYMKEPSHSTWQRAVRIVQSIEVIDERTFVFRLDAPNPLFMQRPLSEVPILPAHIWQGVDDPRTFTDATGSGPYHLVEYRSGQFYRLEAHNDYFHPDYQPAVGSIIMPIIPDQTTLFSSLQAGEVDMATREIPPELVDQLSKPGQVGLERGPLFNSLLLLINHEEAPFDRREFRQALSLMVDTNYLVDTLRLGYGIVGSPGFVHPHSPWLDSTVASHGQDIARAQALLEELGFVDTNNDGYREDALGEAFSISILAYAERPERVRTAEIIASWMEEAGLRTQVRAMEAGTVDALVWPEFDVSKGRDFQLAIWSWSAGIQDMPLSLREVLHTQGNFNVGAFSDEEMDHISDGLLSATTSEQLAPAVTAMAQRAAETVPFVTLWYPDSVYGFRPARYDGWTFVKGLGILDKWSLLAPRLDPDQTVPAPHDSEAAVPGGSSLWWWLVAAAVIVLGTGVLRRRHSQ